MGERVVPKKVIIVLLTVLLASCLCKWGRGWMWRSRVAVQIGTKLLIMGDGLASILKIAISTRKNFARYKLNSTSWQKMVRECMLLWRVSSRFGRQNIMFWDSREVDLRQVYGILRTCAISSWMLSFLVFGGFLRFETKRKWLALVNTNKFFLFFLFLFLLCCCFCKQYSRGRHQGPLLISRNLFLTFTYYRCVTLAHCRPTRTD